MEKKLKIIIDNCPQNHKCPAVKVCPVGALSQEGFNAPKIDYNKYLTKQRKENLIAGERLSAYLSGVVYCRRYKRV
mgnify:CR=1 FL=1